MSDLFTSQGVNQNGGSLEAKACGDPVLFEGLSLIHTVLVLLL